VIKAVGEDGVAVIMVEQWGGAGIDRALGFKHGKPVSGGRETHLNVNTANLETACRSD
jgi:hypothetical protein